MHEIAAETPAAGTRVAAEAWESLFRAQVTLMRRFERGGDFSPLRSREYDVLFTLSLADEGRMRLRHLNEQILMSQPSLSRMVERLENRGLVRRDPAPDDARGVLVGLTAEGAAMQRRIGRQHVRSIRRYVGGALDEEELRTLVALTTRLRTYEP
ncbi:MarR family winged helix-turn-helix transcriptional regulator [Georgenia sp. SYP-B2076]|uniref:MarR family winged helix-turn-helix transcriptional regulator n=1 Tax=Georgenia sp. SYP-B2076 TaxID=2495881 RepID=UPI000F8EC38A|nr:MarR family winged helix-turn-helix transcriptional regulator [Georgenia sp. SYP-B2076]